MANIDKALLEEIAGVYNALSPENLTCDGELRGRPLIAKSARLRRELKALFVRAGRVVDEDETYAGLIETAGGRED